MPTDVCQIDEVHQEAIDAVAARMTDSERLQDLAEFYKVMGDHTRVRILHALSFGELCVCDLTHLLDMSQSAISHQLRVLRAAKLVRFRKEGKNAFYSLDDDHVATLITQGLEHVMEG